MTQPDLFGEQPQKQCSPHKLAVDGFCNLFQKQFGRKYVFSGKDAKAVKTLLTQGIGPDEILQVAAEAWTKAERPKSFYAKHAWTLHGLNHHWNSIVAELQSTGGLASPTVAKATKEKF